MNPVSTDSRIQPRSLSDVHESVATNQISIWKRVLAFSGPAYLISVGYMDPGNWASDLVGGAGFGYKLLWVLVMSNLMAILLQTLSARLGIVTGRDLAQACRETYPRAVNLSLWFLCEIAIVACDLAEVLGAAIALKLLFGMPLLAGVAVTSLDTLLVLGFQKAGIRYLEAFILALIVTIAGCFIVEIILAKPHYGSVAAGLIPFIDYRFALDCGRHARRDRDAAQSLSAFRARPDAPHRTHRRRQARCVPLQSSRLRLRAQRRDVRQRRHSRARRNGFLSGPQASQ